MNSLSFSYSREVKKKKKVEEVQEALKPGLFFKQNSWRLMLSSDVDWEDNDDDVNGDDANDDEIGSRPADSLPTLSQ